MDRSEKINDVLGDNKKFLDDGVFESLLLLGLSETKLNEQLQRINNLSILMENSQLKIQKWMLRNNEERYSKLCRIIEEVASYLDYQNATECELNLEAATKLSEMALKRYIDLVIQWDYLALRSKNILNLIQHPNDIEYTLLRSEIME